MAVNLDQARRIGENEAAFGRGRRRPMRRGEKSSRAAVSVTSTRAARNPLFEMLTLVNNNDGVNALSYWR